MYKLKEHKGGWGTWVAVTGSEDLLLVCIPLGSLSWGVAFGGGSSV